MKINLRLKVKEIISIDFLFTVYKVFNSLAVPSLQDTNENQPAQCSKLYDPRAKVEGSEALFISFL